MMHEPTADTTLEEAKTMLAHAVYLAALYFERLEQAGLIAGNGHHMAQRVAGYAEGVLEGRWRGKEQS